MKKNNLEILVNDIKELEKNYKGTIEVNNSYNYIAIEDYFFQGEDAENLISEYENGCLCDYVTLEQYLIYVSVGW